MKERGEDERERGKGRNRGTSEWGRGEAGHKMKLVRERVRTPC